MNSILTQTHFLEQNLIVNKLTKSQRKLKIESNKFVKILTDTRKLRTHEHNINETTDSTSVHVQLDNNDDFPEDAITIHSNDVNLL